ncbi:hypothetical protein [Frankia sp. R82]|uniref:hypothetical protein n=1 Tax=Frankia sp. R82 TaxID=2950553 RepID=UPI002043CB72|nr:hypothetical protein [Frankia sp. R82]
MTRADREEVVIPLIQDGIPGDFAAVVIAKMTERFGPPVPIPPGIGRPPENPPFPGKKE